MTSVSAGLLLFRRINKRIEVLLAHPGGPYWRNKDHRAWTIPKGEFDTGHPLEAARREFAEENKSANSRIVPLGRRPGTAKT
jgi:predicted NUDIX family NTP pyrophosphohydrolase